ncbi:MAG TPA: class I SAM-dependent methyltransferase [Dongiaceae bacterium]|jgi:SAM-dependent methyltransferase|nr:class I SAM-dependent methyltransferase [Dongiaceae bacterium]
MEAAEYEKLAATESSMWWFKALHGLVADQVGRMKLAPGARLLDAGCGTGGMLLSLGGRYPALDLGGVELDPAAARLAEARSGKPVAIGSIGHLPQEDASLDAVVSLDVLCHAGVSVEGSLAEFARCLKPGGHLVLSLPAYQWMLSGHDVAVSNVRRFTRGGLRPMLRAAGFGIEADGYWNSLLFPLMLAHRFLSRSAAESDVRAFPAWQDRLFNRVLDIEAAMRRHGLALPFGGSVWVRARRR